MALFLERGMVPPRLRPAITADVVALGAADVAELTGADWEDIPSWPLIEPFRNSLQESKYFHEMYGFLVY